jgi:hypothetical protein
MAWITNSISVISSFIPTPTSLKHVFNANSVRYVATNHQGRVAIVDGWV